MPIFTIFSETQEFNGLPTSGELVRPDFARQRASGVRPRLQPRTQRPAGGCSPSFLLGEPNEQRPQGLKLNFFLTTIDLRLNYELTESPDMVL